MGTADGEVNQATKDAFSANLQHFFDRKQTYIETGEMYDPGKHLIMYHWVFSSEGAVPPNFNCPIPPIVPAPNANCDAACKLDR